MKMLYDFEGQKQPRECAMDVRGKKRHDYYSSFLFQTICLVATVVSSGLSFAVQEPKAFELGLTESATGAGFPSGYTFKENDTNVEEEGTVAPEGQVFVVSAAGILLGRPFVDNSGAKRYSEWLDEYKVAAMEAILSDAHVRFHPEGENGPNFSLGALMLNPSMRGIAASESIPQAVQNLGGLPVPLDGKLILTNEDSLIKVEIPRAFDVPARATIAAATAYFPVTICLEGRAMTPDAAGI